LAKVSKEVGGVDPCLNVTQQRDPSQQNFKKQPRKTMSVKRMEVRKGESESFKKKQENYGKIPAPL